jgi:glycosyltransferase involved in cell wall biosynthesis
MEKRFLIGNNMKIAILTSGLLPVPAVQGGAVENLIDFYLDYNDQHHLHDITVYSIWHPDVKRHPALKSKVNHYHFIHLYSLTSKFRKWVYFHLHGFEYYHHNYEFYMECAMKDIRKKQYDLIILENRPGYALKLKENTTCKLVHHLHNDLLNSKTKHAMDIYDAASRIITVSDYIASRVRTINTNDNKCIIVHNGIDTKTFNKEVSPAHIPSINNKDFVLLFSGRINNEKGIEELISAMTIIGRDYPIKLLVLGGSFYGITDNNNPFISKLREMAEPVKEKIIFTGFIPYKEMPSYLRLADVAVLPSTWDEPFGLTMSEAQAMGLPIITTRRGGIPEVVSEKNAIMLDTDEHFIKNLANAIIDLYEHPEKRVAMAKASLERSKLFDKETYARNFFMAIDIV